MYRHAQNPVFQLPFFKTAEFKEVRSGGAAFQLHEGCMGGSMGATWVVHGGCMRAA